MNTFSKDQRDQLLLQQLQELLLKSDREQVQKLQNILDSYDLLSEPSQKDYLGEYMDCAEPAVDVVEEIPMAVE